MFKKFFILGFTLFHFTVGFIIAHGNDKQILISERIYLNTDRKIYIAGENLLFNLYLLDVKSNSLANYPSIGYVVIRNKKGELLGKSQVKIVNGKAAGAIYLADTLQSGYYHVVAYTNFMRNGSPDIFFKSQILVANRFDNDFFELISGQNSDNVFSDTLMSPSPAVKKVNIIPGKAAYSKREKASLKINISDRNIKLLDFSVSIVEKNLVEESLVAKASLVKARDSKGVFFDVSEKSETPIHLAEDKYAELLGRLTDLNSGSPVGYQVLYLSSPDTVNNFKYTVTNSKGYFRFPLSDYYNGKDILIKIRQNDGESLNPKIEIDSKFKVEGAFTFPSLPVDSSVISYLKNSQNIVRIQKSFSLIQPVFKPRYITSTVPLLFRVPDFTAAPADFVELKDFVEIAREILPALKIRKRDNLYYAEILDWQKGLFMPPKPLIFLDGVLIDDINQIIPYGTKDIKKVDVISSKWIVDHQELEGVLSVNSYNSLWKNLTLNNNNLLLKAESYYELPNLYQPNYSIVDVKSREPDFRQLLYWNPNCSVSQGNAATVEFYTSDYAASYIIKITGISDKGEIVEGYSKIEVKDKF
jgi:hypothetical protein